MNWLFVALALLAGALLPLQALINAQLGRAIGGALLASTVSFLVGSVALSAVVAVSRQPLPVIPGLGRLPMWIWAGGVIGATFVAIATFAIPRLGAASLVALVVLGQLVASLLLDKYGILQTPQPVNATRVIGAVLILVGVLLVLQPWKVRG